MATVLLVACLLAAASSGGAEPWDPSEGAWECAGVDDSAEATEDWPSSLEGLWLSQGCEPPQEWGGAWSLRSLVVEPQTTSGAAVWVRATLVRHVYADEWCARPLYSVAAVASLLRERRHGDEAEGRWSVRMEAASGCGHSWEGVRRVLALCCACAQGGRHAKPHRELSLYSRGPQQRAHAPERDNVASRRHAGPAPLLPHPASADCVSRLLTVLPLQQLPQARVQTTAHRLGLRRTLLLAADGGGRAQPPLLHAAQQRGCAACWAVSRGSLTSPPQLSARPRLPASAAAAPAGAAAWAAPGSCHPPSPAASLHFDAAAASWQLQLEVRCVAPGPSWRAVTSGQYVAEGALLRLRRARLTLEGAAGAAGCPPDPQLALLDVDAEGDPALLVWAAGCGAAPVLELMPPLRLRRCRPQAAAHVAGAAPTPAAAASLLLVAWAALRLAGLPWR